MTGKAGRTRPPAPGPGRDAGGDPSAPARLPQPDTFLSGEHGEVGGKRGLLRKTADITLDRWLQASGALRRIDRAAAQLPARDVTVASIYRPPADRLEQALQQLSSDHHRVELRLGSMEELTGGKFENLNTLIDPTAEPDWLLIVDDDVALPPRFLDRMIGLAELFHLEMAAPAQSLASHAAWRVTRRRPRSILRETNFVEIGPVTLISSNAAETLLPFPPLRYGWGLDLAWAATALDRGWRLGIADALPVRHEAATVGSAYPTDAAIEEARTYLATRPYLSSAAAQQTQETHRSLPK